MNWLDIVILIVLAVGVLNGVQRGLFRQIFLLIGIVVGFLVASPLYSPFASYLGFIPDKNWQNVVAFAIVMLVCMGVFVLSGESLQRRTSGDSSGSMSVLLGGFLGLLETGIIVAVALNVLVKYPVLGVAPAIKASAVATALLDRAPAIISLAS